MSHFKNSSFFFRYFIIQLIYKIYAHARRYGIEINSIAIIQVTDTPSLPSLNKSILLSHLGISHSLPQNGLGDDNAAPVVQLRFRIYGNGKESVSHRGAEFLFNLHGFFIVVINIEPFGGA